MERPTAVWYSLPMEISGWKIPEELIDPKAQWATTRLWEVVGRDMAFVYYDVIEGPMGCDNGSVAILGNRAAPRVLMRKPLLRNSGIDDKLQFIAIDGAECVMFSNRAWLRDKNGAGETPLVILRLEEPLFPFALVRFRAGFAYTHARTVGDELEFRLTGSYNNDWYRNLKPVVKISTRNLEWHPIGVWDKTQEEFERWLQERPPPID